MIRQLSIRNLALVERLDIDFEPGLNLLTGETGSGKSIIVDSLGLALGERAAPDVVRAGSATGTVRAVFEVRDQALEAGLADLGHPPDEGLVELTRELSRAGRGVSRVNGQVVTSAQLRQVGDLLVDVHGQREHQSLLQQERLLLALDTYAAHLPLRADVAAAHARWTELGAVVRALRADDTHGQRELELMRYDLAEIEALGPEPEEDVTLAVERSTLVNAERLQASGRELLGALDGDDDGRAPGALGALSRALTALDRVADLDPGVEALAAQLRPQLAELEETRRATREYADRVRVDPARLEAVEARLDALADLKRRHGGSLEGVLARAEAARAGLAAGLRGLDLLAQQEAELVAAESALAAAATTLSRSRGEAATRLSSLVERELGDLKMEAATFQVVLGRVRSEEGLGVEDEHLQCRQSGIDTVELTLAANPGEPQLPLQRVASGGEVSRVMLALRTVLAGADPVPTIVLDEVDVGIGGQTAVRLGDKLRSIARERQVLCVTHLASIAALADHHVLVHKEAQGSRRVVLVTALTGDDQRAPELARLLAGDAGGDAALETARQLLRGARQGATA